MSDLIQLTDAELGLVSGGAITINQTNSSSISQSASATNNGAITANANGGTNGDGGVAAVSGASASNSARVSQRNIAVGVLRVHLDF